MHPPRFLMHAVFGVFDKAAALLGSTEPLTWLTMPARKPRSWDSIPVALYEVDGRTYVMDEYPSKGWSSSVRIPGTETLTTGRADVNVTLTEVTDPAVKHRVVIAYAAVKPKLLLSFGEQEHREPESFLVSRGLATGSLATLASSGCWAGLRPCTRATALSLVRCSSASP